MERFANGKEKMMEKERNAKRRDIEIHRERDSVILYCIAKHCRSRLATEWSILCGTFPQLNDKNCIATPSVALNRNGICNAYSYMKYFIKR